jgi:hypothetical protein
MVTRGWLLALALGVGCEPAPLVLGTDGRSPGSLQDGPPDEDGVWTTLPQLMAINPIHAMLLPEVVTRQERESLGQQIGTVLVLSGSGDFEQQVGLLSEVRDFGAGTVDSIPMPFDAFCSGMTQTASGNAFVVGGNRYDQGLPEGIDDTWVFRTAPRDFQSRTSMAHERWYPTATTLGDGRVMVDTGWGEYTQMNATVEIWTPGVGWSPEYPMGWNPPLYMRQHLLPDGTVFYGAPETESRLFDPAAVSATSSGWSHLAWTNYGNGPNEYNREYGSSVLLPLTPDNGYEPTVMILGGNRANPTATTELIDLSVSNPAWRWGASMEAPRVRMQATLLPDGSVLALGGASTDVDELFATLQAERYDPATDTFSAAGTMEYAHLDHTVALLLPDATVWVAGSQQVIPNFQQHMEVYQPPYLFAPDGSLATRPVIDRAPTRVRYDTGFRVHTTEAADIASVVLMKPGAVTHSFDTDQRAVGLAFTVGAGVLDLVGPPNGNIAPPGWYLLFLVDAAGVPSVATFVNLR